MYIKKLKGLFTIVYHVVLVVLPFVQHDTLTDTNQI